MLFALGETSIMAVQAWRGVPSHYNFSTPLDVALMRGGAAGTAAEAAPNLPTIDDVAMQGGVPEMHIDLHVYSTNPQDRFVFINGSKYVEGAMLAEGPRLQRIAPNGAVLVYLGHRFLLAPQ